MKLGIYGYGNIGKGVELAAKQNSDVEVVGIFTRRDKNTIKSILGNKVYNANEIKDFKDKIDILAICGGSATELPTMTVELCKDFNVIDTFDTHKNIPTHFNNVDKVAKENNHIAMISCGWDPGMFSLNRLYGEALLPNGHSFTFWGKGISQGHSDAIRRINGVIDAKQYTIPIDAAIDRIKKGDNPTFTAREMHRRECFVVADENADKSKIEQEIKSMPNYFSDYDTTVHFISLEELKEKHYKMPHAGMVIRTGNTGEKDENKHIIQYNLTLDSNPEFTAMAVIAFSRALLKEKERGVSGCLTVFDIRPKDLSIKSYDELLKTIL